ncbi:radical SAM protein [Aquihabitans sp. G128]|uniref:radical SAM protein n=1 Tax=Aquihabitans sp. G128 TaxID=2849779 RepID=UPI001C21E6C6|nr:radical SAM protein [Aquihabitans sp. G128]QXC62925.1 radical SAM protein [Aquihabitans sp. G128]
MAPFTSMYFDQFGSVLACCINTVQPIGAYPRDRVADVWSGVAAQQLRRALADDDFSKGCHDCHSSIGSGNFDAVNAMFDQQVAQTPARWVAEHPPTAPDHHDPWPRLLEFSLSTRCNLRCTMCSGYCSSAIRRAEGQPLLPEPYGEDFVEQLRPFLEHVGAVKFYGGEPFLAPVNFAIWEALVELNPSCKVSITTNGTIWNDRVRRVVEGLDVAITVSIDAATSTTFEAIRLGADHAQVLANAERFAAAAGGLNLAVCAMQQNWHEVPDIVRMANQRGWNLAFNVVRYPSDHSLASLGADGLGAVVAAWDSFDHAEEPGAAAGGTTASNLERFASMRAQARGWLEAAQPSTTDVTVSASAAGARERRRAWIDLVAELAGLAGAPDGHLGEGGFAAELDRLIAGFEAAVPSEAQGARLAGALAALLEEAPDDVVAARFDHLGRTLAASSVTHRIRAMAELPPALIAQGVAHEDPRTMAARLDSFFPPLRPASAGGAGS